MLHVTADLTGVLGYQTMSFRIKECPPLPGDVLCHLGLQLVLWVLLALTRLYRVALEAVDTDTQRG